MIENKEQALELCKKYEVHLKDHKTVIVTENNNIYLSDNIDPADIGKVFYLKGDKVTNEEIQKEEKSEDDLTLDEEIQKEEQDKKSKKNK